MNINCKKNNKSSKMIRLFKKNKYSKKKQYQNNSSEVKDYILFVGHRDSYKNFNRFLEAVSPLLLKYDLKLLCTGPIFNNVELEFINNLNINDKVIHIFVAEDKLKDLYSNALFFVYPSLYEGFGIPILEAFSSGCPVLLSNASCFPEIAGDAAIYFDPYSLEDMQQKIRDLLLSSSRQDEYRKKGYDKIKQFSWKKTAIETYDLYSDSLSLPLPPNNIRLVITVHDMVHELFSGKNDHIEFKKNKYLHIKYSDKIIAVSNNTKNDILKIYPDTNPDKIKVIYHGI